MQRITKELIQTCMGRRRSKIEFLVRPMSNMITEQEKVNHSNIHDLSVTSKVICEKPRNAGNVEIIECKQFKNKNILLYDANDKGLITLNRPKFLNALCTPMCEELLTVLKEWESSKKLIILKAAGEKAFCCGGDLRIMKHVRPDNFISARNFFNAAYKLYYIFGTYKVPVIALMNHITMGGGAGLSIHGKYKVITEKSIFAMPETAIGFFVDAGCTYVLPRLQGQLGLFLALTGYRLKGIDIIRAGIATHYVLDDQLQNLEQELLSSDDTNFDEILEKYRANDSGVEFSLSPYMEKINTCFSADSVEEIIERLQNDGSEWSQNVVKTLSKMSPTSLKVTYQALREGKNLSFKDCIKMEHKLSQTFIRAYSDFYEGSKTPPHKREEPPNWYPKTVREVTIADVLKRFTSSSSELKL